MAADSFLSPVHPAPSMSAVWSTTRRVRANMYWEEPGRSRPAPTKPTPSISTRECGAGSRIIRPTPSSHTWGWIIVILVSASPMTSIYLSCKRPLKTAAASRSRSSISKKLPTVTTSCPARDFNDAYSRHHQKVDSNALHHLHRNSHLRHLSSHARLHHRHYSHVLPHQTHLPNYYCAQHHHHPHYIRPKGAPLHPNSHAKPD